MHKSNDTRMTRLSTAIRLTALAGGALLGAALPSAPALAQAAAEEVVVTGSRIVRRDLDSSSPIVTVGQQSFEESSTLAVESVLNQMPQFVPDQTQFNTGNVFPSATSTPGISTVNLRGVGAQRTLVLVDGRRAQPVNSTLVVDVNSIPSSAIESVEVITGGASAVYGADALGGVTNFKLRSNFEGMDLQFRTGMTERGDGEENRVNMVLGSNLADGRGNAMLAVEWTERKEVMAYDRPFMRRAMNDSNTNAGTNARMNTFQYEPTALNRPDVGAVQGLYPGLPAGFNYSPLAGSPFLLNDDNSLYKVERGGLGFNGDPNSPEYRIAPNGQLVPNNYDLRYSAPMDRYSIFAKADYQFSDRLEAYSQIMFVNTSNLQVLQPTGAVGGFGSQIPYGNGLYGGSVDANGNTLPEYMAGGAYGLDCPAVGGCTNSQVFPVPEQLAMLLNSRGPDQLSTTQFDPNTGQPLVTAGVNSPWNIGGTFGQFMPARQMENTTTLFQMIAGLRGEVGIKDWTWDAYVSRGETRIDLDYIGFVSTSRWQEVVSSPNYGRGLSLSGTGSTEANCTSGIPVFGSFDISQDCINAISPKYVDRTRLTQDVFEATAQGAVMDLPAGEVRAAVGATYRNNSFQYMPDASRERNSFLDIPVGSFGQANVIGSIDVKEIYGELLIPVLRDKPFVQDLELELGYRYSDYGDNGGTVPTWKALFSWQPIDHVRFRGGYQLANRAPNINELYLDASSVAVTMRSPDYCRADTREPSGNNPANPNRAAAQALCSALIANPASEFDADPSNYVGGRGDGVILQVNSGNRNLRSEEGKTWTFGAILSSPFQHPAMSNATLSLDWYNIKIEDAISTVSAQISYDLCFNRDGRSNPTYSVNDTNGVCANIERDPDSGAALLVNSQFQNLGLLETSGIDANFNWNAGLDDLGFRNAPGMLMLNMSFSRLFEYKAQEFATALPLENAGTLARGGLFDWRLTTNLRYMRDSWSVGLNWRHLPSVRNAQWVTDNDTPIRGASSYDVFALTGNWDITETFAISGGVDNLFDAQPRRVGAGQVQNIAAVNGGGQTVINGVGSTNPAFYDVLGRRYFVNLKLRF